MRFSNPVWLFGLIALAIWWRYTRIGDDRAHWRGGLRALTIAAVMLAAAGLEIAGGTAAVTGIVVLDRSDSLPDRGAALGLANSLLSGMRRDDRAGLVVFAADAAVERIAAARPAWTDIVAQLRADGTNIEAGLRLARARLPPDGDRRIVLVSDGLQTAGDAVREATAAAADGVRIDVALMEAAGEAAPMVTAVAAPASVAIGESFAVVASLYGRPSSNAVVTLQSGTGAKQQQAIRIGPDGFASATFSWREVEGGAHAYHVAIADEAGSAAGEPVAPTSGAVVVADSESRVLVVAPRSGVIVELLRRHGLRVEYRPPALLPGDAAALSAFDAIVLDDLQLADLPDAPTAALASYVQQLGGGLLILGSERTLEPALSANRTLAPLLPIDLRPRSGRRAPRVALVVAFDKSGSMDDTVEGGQKIEFARQAVLRLLDTMPLTDAVGVIAFDNAAAAVVPLAPGHDPATIAAALRGVRPGGATAIAPALAKAREWLRSPAAAAFERRHILLISDGRTSAADAAQARAATGRDVAVSAVALGSATDSRLLSALAAQSGGRAYFPDSITELPLLVAREATRVAGGASVEERFVPRPSAHAILGGVNTARLPALHGYVVSALRPLAQPVLTSHLDDPVIAASPAGSGRVAVYTADLHGRWSQELRQWNGLGALLGQTVRWISRRAGHENLFVLLDREGGGMRVTLEAHSANGRNLNALTVRAVVQAPGNASREVVFRPSAPGRYETFVDAADVGPHVLTVEARSADGTFDQRVVRGFYWSGSGEGQRRGADRALLDGLARATGGRVLERGEGMFTAPRPVTYLAARPSLTALALCLFLADLLQVPIAALLARARRRLGARPPAGAARTGTAA
jgi:Mg-chelatase subunit ChlD